MTATTMTTTNEILIGEWGASDGQCYEIRCSPEVRDAVQSAWDEIEEGDDSPDVLDGVKSAGGVLVPIK